MSITYKGLVMLLRLKDASPRCSAKSDVSDHARPEAGVESNLETGKTLQELSWADRRQAGAPGQSYHRLQNLPGQNFWSPAALEKRVPDLTEDTGATPKQHRPPFPVRHAHVTPTIFIVVTDPSSRYQTEQVQGLSLFPSRLAWHMLLQLKARHGYGQLVHCVNHSSPDMIESIDITFSSRTHLFDN